jgi:RsiW-degrading membrane proteinase PrsW (M82 family)
MKDTKMGYPYTLDLASLKTATDTVAEAPKIEWFGLTLKNSELEFTYIPTSGEISLITTAGAYKIAYIQVISDKNNDNSIDKFFKVSKVASLPVTAVANTLYVLSSEFNAVNPAKGTKPDNIKLFKAGTGIILSNALVLNVKILVAVLVCQDNKKVLDTKTDGKISSKNCIPYAPATLHTTVSSFFA